MKRILLFGLVSALIFGACGPEKIAPLAERIQKLWSAQVVKENSTTTFTKGATTNTRPGYTAFRLDLSSASTVVFVDFDGTRCTGTWEVSSDEKRLILKNLSPQPTGTNGTIEFTITEVTDAKLVLTRTTASQKTGGTINVYELIVG
ncbi:MAG: hypothetical protein EAZ91_06445 [Cytophagales bacterium]|nr:MAG: hypothetical protein EAZ91_06445 [Cytophagales bacterium]